MYFLKKYIKKSSIHCLHYIAEKRLYIFERIFWGSCILLSLVGAILINTNAFEQYRLKAIAFAVDTSYTEWTTNFPSIVFCEKGNNKIQDFRNEWFGNSTFRTEMAKDIAFFRGYFDYKEMCKISGSRRNECLMGNFLYYMMNLRSTCEELFTACYYNNQRFNCCEEVSVISSYYGICFAFNNRLPTGNVGKLPFVVNRTSYAFGNLTTELSNDEVIVSALGQDDVPSVINANAILLSSDSNTAIKKMKSLRVLLSIKETLTDLSTKFIHPTQRGCNFYDENTLKSVPIYSLGTCYNECLGESHYNLCNCTLHTLPNIGHNECDLDGLLCLYDKQDIIAASIKDCNCPISCFESEVQHIGTIQKKAVPFGFIGSNNSVVRLEFNVQAPVLRYARTLVRSPISIMVSIGGTIGFFLGASVLSVVEIIYHFSIYLYERISRRKQ